MALVASKSPGTSVHRNLERIPKHTGLQVALPPATPDVVVTLHELSYQLNTPSLGHDRRDGICLPFSHTPDWL